MKIVTRSFFPTKNSQKYVRQKDFYLSFFEIFYCCIVILPTKISSTLPYLTSTGYWRSYWNLLCKEMSGEGRHHRKSCIWQFSFDQENAYTKTSSKSRSPISLFNTAKWQVGWWHILRQYWYINVKLNNLHKFNIDVSTTCWARTDGLPNVLTEKIIGPSLDQRTPERFFRVGIWVGPKLSVE